VSDRRELYSALVIAAAVSITSGTIFGFGPDPVEFDSEPPGAEVVINGATVGFTPLVLRVRSEKQYWVTFRKPGYNDATVKLTSRARAGWVVLEMLAGTFGPALSAVASRWVEFVEVQRYVVMRASDDKAACSAL
jgi:hypothetical protein